MKKKVLFVILFILLVIFIIILKENRVLLKFLTGSARIAGKPIVDVKVYVDGKLNNKIKVFHIDKYWNNSKADYYVLYGDLTYARVFLVDRARNLVADPVSSSKDDYDIILGYLFQSDSGALFVPLDDGVKGPGFDANLVIKENEITFDLPTLEKTRIINVKLVFDKTIKK